MIKKGQRWLYCLLSIVSVCLGCSLTSQAVSAVSGSETFNVVENWNTYFDGTWHQNASDGTVSVPHQILGTPSSGRKLVSWSRFKLGTSGRGSTQNQFNTVSVKLTIIGGTIQGTNLIDPVGYFYQSSGSDITASCNVTNVSSSGFEIVCSATLGRGSLWEGFDIRTDSRNVISTDYYGYTVSGGSSIRLTQIYLEWNGTEDPNTALLEGIQGDTQTIINQSETIINQNNQINNSIQNLPDEIAQKEEDAMEGAQDEAQNASDDASDEAENATQSLREGISNIIQMVRETPASDCNIRINFRIDTGVMNMCQMPDQFKTLIQSVTTIVGTIAILNISYELLLMYIDHIRSFQDGGKEDR